MVKCSKALKNDHRHIRHLTLLHKSTLITGIYHVRNTWNYYAKFRPCVMLIINSILVLFPQMFDTFVSDRWAFPCCREKTHLTLHADITHFAPLQRKTNHSNTLNQMFFCTLIALRCQRYLGLPPVFRSVTIHAVHEGPKATFEIIQQVYMYIDFLSFITRVCLCFKCVLLLAWQRHHGDINLWLPSCRGIFHTFPNISEAGVMLL